MSSDEISSSDSHVEKKHYKRRLKQKQVRRGYENDSPYLGACQPYLPSVTSDWTFNSLDSLGITYSQKPTNVLDMIFNETGLFRTLTGEERKYVKELQDSLNFSTSIRAMLSSAEMFTIVKPDCLVKEMKQDLANIMKMQNSRSASFHATQDFITSIELMVAYQSVYLRQDGIRAMTQGPVSKDVFADIFKAFSKICHLLPVPGSAWKGKMDIYHEEKISVTSSADIVIFPQNYSEDVFGIQESNSLFIVSVEELKNLKSQKDKTEELVTQKVIRSHGETSSSEDVIPPKPYITTKIREGILGQHGGDLLLHYLFYRSELRRGPMKKYMPGMIVCGTEVTLTLLVMKTDHLRELESDVLLSPDSRATIHYSAPLDLLKKEDRDVLIDSFARLNNV